MIFHKNFGKTFSMFFFFTFLFLKWVLKCIFFNILHEIVYEYNTHNKYRLHSQFIRLYLVGIVLIVLQS